MVSIPRQQPVSKTKDEYAYPDSTAQQKQHTHKKPAIWKSLVAGGVAGAVSRTVTSPLERTKILFQVQNMNGHMRTSEGALKYSGVLPTLKTMVNEEGVAGFFRGNGVNILRIAPYTAIQFFSFEKFKLVLSPEGAGDMTALRRMMAGALAGTTAVIMTYPLDLVRTRLTIQTTDMHYSGIGQGLRHIVKTEGGYTALFRGMAPTLMGIAPYVAINFSTYETLKSFFVPSDKPPSVPQSLAFGGFSGALAQTITYPIDLTRRRMQLQGFRGQKEIYCSAWDCIKQTVKTEGIGGLYKGMVPCYLKVVPAIAISFCTYEVMKQALNIETCKSTYKGSV
jgi:solute carrier family 25 phosphate transporter 23/24/25/41